ncbi:hypothetical protein ACFFIS_08355 [Virgibacillus soli]|uniref:Uncharacterized protein n=1 Tax=Paracerasibacillus soli TaxID=480284 RepID=A0ABU5CPX1_9BACI|nr:hypothetical protein [Virgibacillus soli]MDY0407921.1 hypothetical protein [Virgibacillus soli]
MPQKNTLKRQLDIIAKHLEKNESLFQKPEEKLYEFENELASWNEEFLKSMSEVEKVMDKLIKKMEN